MAPLPGIRPIPYPKQPSHSVPERQGHRTHVAGASGGGRGTNTWGPGDSREAHEASVSTWGHCTQPPPPPISLQNPQRFPSQNTIWWRYREKQKLTTGNHSKLPPFKPVGLAHNLFFIEVTPFPAAANPSQIRAAPGRWFPP